ncbi:MAG: hypothetical protein WDO56_01910 [Gammaproteobacteria bacterium]
MARSSLHTSLAFGVLMVALGSGCGTAGQSAADAAGDPGIADPTAAAEPSADKDNDGVPADQDLCPNTKAAEKVDGNGCSAEQRATQKKAQSDATVASNEGKTSGGKPGGGPDDAENADAGSSSTDSSDAKGPADSNGTNNVNSDGSGALLADGTVAPNGFAVFVLDPKGALPVTLRTLASNVTNLANGGFALNGTVTIDVPGDSHVTLAETKVQLSYDADKGEGLQSFSGSVRLPFPDLGFMQGVSVSDPVYAAVGYDLGKQLTNVDAPIKADRKYLYFTFSAGFEAKVGDMTVSGANNQSVTMTLDPSDPSFFLRASLGGLMGPVDDASIGFSIGGHLPFTPQNTWGIDAKSAAFDGHLWIGGKVNLNDLKLPVAIGGNTVVDLDPSDSGKTFFTNPAGGFGFGSNSELDLSVSAGVLSFELPIAQSTIVGRITGKDGAADYSGVVNAGNGWMPDAVPVKNTQQLKAAGHASTQLTDSYLMAEGDLSLDAGKLGQWTGLDLSDVALVKATLNADSNGLTVTGTASTSISPYLGLKGDLATVGFFNGKPKDWYVTMDGRLAVSGIDLSANAHARIDQNGMLVTGKFQTPISLIDMSGSISHAGVDLEGKATVTFPIVAGKEVLQWVTDAAVCGTETVADAAVCGSETVANGAVCGYNTVKDATLCGTSIVTDSAQCGTKTVQDAALCGSHVVTDAAVCGYKTVTSCIECVSVLWGGSCSCGQTANSCSVASSCSVAKSCSVPTSCQIAKTCSVPKSCEKVKTCQTKVTVPDFNYGTFQAEVDVKIGNSGLEGAVSGSYCPTGSTCSTLAGGRVKVSSNRPEACITVPGVGEVCAPF